MKRVVNWDIEALDYSVDDAEKVLAMFPDEWDSAHAQPLLGETSSYRAGEDVWSVVRGDRYVKWMAPVQSMLDADFREAKLADVRVKFVAAES